MNKEKNVTNNRSSGKLKLFFAANAFTSVGMNIGVVGVAWFVIHSTGKNSILGLYNALSLLAAFCALIGCSSLIDHRSKTALMKYCSFGQSLLFAFTAVLCQSGAPALFVICMLALLNMPGMVVFTTASRGAVPAVLPPPYLAKGNSLIEITLQLGAMAAALLTAFFYGRLGFVSLMWAGACSTFAGGILFAYAKNAFDFPSPLSAGWKRNITDGIIFLWRQKKLFLYGMIVFMPTIVISVSNVIIPGYVQFTLRRGAMTYGLADMIFALGALTSGLYAARLKTGYGKLHAVLFAVSAGCMFFLALNSTLTGFLGAIFIAGVVMAGLRILLNASFMQRVPSEYLGRALAVLMALSVVLQAVLSYFIGLLMDYGGSLAGFMFMTGMLLLGLIGCLCLSFAKRNTKIKS